MIFKSIYVNTHRSQDDFFALVSDMNNVKKFLPDQIVNVTADRDNISFTIQGMGNVTLRVSQRISNSLVQLVPVGKVPFPFSLDVNIRPCESESECMFQIDADLSPIMSMMAKKPLQNLVNMMAEKVELLF